MPSPRAPSPRTEPLPVRPAPALPRGTPPRGVPATFADDPSGRVKSFGTSFFRLQAVPRVMDDCELRAYVATRSFAGKSAALFRRTDLDAFVDCARAFAEGRVPDVSLQGGAFAGSGLIQVLIGLHIYRPVSDHGRAAVRVVVASRDSDDLLTATLQSAPLLIAQFADQIAALTDGARETATLIGQ